MVNLMNYYKYMSIIEFLYNDFDEMGKKIYRNQQIITSNIQSYSQHTFLSGAKKNEYKNRLEKLYSVHIYAADCKLPNLYINNVLYVKILLELLVSAIRNMRD
jgi:hypothetical protein